jgi:predicted DNA-binding transcriptional regulator AlpA
MPVRHRRPRLGTEGAASETAECVSIPQSIPPAPDPPVPIRDKLAWSTEDLCALLGLSRRLICRLVASGEMPKPDLRLCRRALWRPATVTTWLDSQASRGGSHS